MMHTYRQPRILRIRLLDIELVDYEKLSDITVTLCCLDLNEPKPVILKIDLTSNPSLHCLLEKVDLVEIPDSEEVKWEFCVLNAGKVSSLLDSSSPVKSHLDEVLGLVEVPVSGRVMSFFTYQENPLNRVGTPGIVAVSDLCSNNIETALEEVIPGEIGNFSCIENTKFPFNFFRVGDFNEINLFQETVKRRVRRQIYLHDYRFRFVKIKTTQRNCNIRQLLIVHEFHVKESDSQNPGLSVGVHHLQKMF